jgi:hypothetical protein
MSHDMRVTDPACVEALGVVVLFASSFGPRNQDAGSAPGGGGKEASANGRRPLEALGIARVVNNGNRLFLSKILFVLGG